jgi:hypothetical protein
MPFCNPMRFEFTEGSIRQNAPAQSAVYGLFADQEWIYVGESWNVQERLLWHSRGDNPWLKRGKKPTGFTFEAVPSEERLTRQKELVDEFKPVCN